MLPSFRGELADMYSLGILLFIMYFGVPPFKNSNVSSMPDLFVQLYSLMVSGNPLYMQAFLENHPLTAPVLKKGLISTEFRNLLTRLLSFPPENRPSAYELLAADPWINVPEHRLLSYDEYHAIMERQYLLNHNMPLVENGSTDSGD